jgi:hypothetical protein
MEFPRKAILPFSESFFLTFALLPDCNIPDLSEFADFSGVSAVFARTVP